MGNLTGANFLPPKAVTFFIHAGAGYGKTTLLAQVAAAFENSVWLTIDSAKSVSGFVSELIGAIRFRYPDNCGSVENRSGRYCICRDDIMLDTDLYEDAVDEFQRNRNMENAQKLVSLYKGEYLETSKLFGRQPNGLPTMSTIKRPLIILKGIHSIIQRSSIE